MLCYSLVQVLLRLFQQDHDVDAKHAMQKHLLEAGLVGRLATVIQHHQATEQQHLAIEVLLQLASFPKFLTTKPVELGTAQNQAAQKACHHIGQRSQQNDTHIRNGAAGTAVTKPILGKAYPAVPEFGAHYKPALLSTTSATAAAPIISPDCELDLCLPELLFYLKQLLSPAAQHARVQQMVLQTVTLLAGVRHATFIELLIAQGWVQVLWGFMPGGTELLSAVLPRLQQAQAVASSEHGTTVSNPVLQCDAHSTASADTATACLSVTWGAEHQEKDLDGLHAPAQQHAAYALQALAHICSCQAGVLQLLQLQRCYDSLPASMFTSGQLYGTVTSPLSQDGRSSSAASIASSSSSGFLSRLGLPGRQKSSDKAAEQHAVDSLSSKDSTGKDQQPLASRSVGFRGSSSGSWTGMPVVSAAAVGSVGSPPTCLGRTMSWSNSSHAQSSDPPSAPSTPKLAPPPLITTSASSVITASVCPYTDAAVPHSPIHCLVKLLHQQWSTPAAAQLLTQLAGADISMVAGMMSEGLAPVLIDCMTDVQDNGPGAVVAVAVLDLVTVAAEASTQLHSAGVLIHVRRMLKFDCSELVRQHALAAMSALCQSCDRSICSAVAQTALLPLSEWLRSGDAVAAGIAATAIQCLLDCSVLDQQVTCQLSGKQDAGSLLAHCMACMPAGGQAQPAADPVSQQKSQLNKPTSNSAHAAIQPSTTLSNPAAVHATAAASTAQAETVALTAIRLVHTLVLLDERFATALIDLDGVRRLVTLIQEPGIPLAWKCEALSCLDGLSLCHREDIVQADIIPAIVFVLRMHVEHRTSSGDHADSNGSSSSRSSKDTALVSSSSSGVLQHSSGALARSSSSPAVGAHNDKPAPEGFFDITSPGLCSALTGLASYRSLSTRLRRVSSGKGSSKAAVGEHRSTLQPENDSDEPSPAELTVRAKITACNLITVLAFNNDVKRQLFHSDAVGPLMQLANCMPAQTAVRSALSQMGLIYLLPQ